jgi:hypothetical protein
MARRDEYEPREEWPEDWDAEYEPTSEKVDRHEQVIASLNNELVMLREEVEGLRGSVIVLIGAVIVTLVAIATFKGL